MSSVFLASEKVRISLTYAILSVETLLELALPALVGFAIDGVMAGSNQGLYLLVAGILALVVSGSCRKLYDTRAFGRIQSRLAMLIGARSAAPSTKVAHIRLLDDLAQFFDTFLPQAIGSAISTFGAVAVLFFYDWKIGAASLAALTVIGLFLSIVATRTARLNRRINQRLEQEAQVIQAATGTRLGRHIEALRRLRNGRSDAETLMFAFGWMVLCALIVFALFEAAGGGITAGQIFAVLSYVLAVADGFAAMPPAIERMTRTGDILRRLQALSEPEANEARAS